jgi:phosphoadenosine phosphosulfate reductase
MKIDLTKKLIKEAFEKYKRPLVAASYGKNSTTLLYIIRQMYGKIPCPVLSNDTGFWFPEVEKFMHKLRKEWDLEIIKITRYHPKAKDKPPDAIWHTKELKIMPMLLAIRGYGADVVIDAVRERGKDYVEKRAGSVRVHPLLHWSEDDIWLYIKSNDIPYCELYDKGYKSLGDWPFTKLSKNERGGRDKKKEEMMKKLREAGYW